MRKYLRALHKRQTGAVGLITIILTIAAVIGMTSAGLAVIRVGGPLNALNWLDAWIAANPTEQGVTEDDVEHVSIQTYACTDNVLTSAMNNYMWAIVSLPETGELQTYATRIGRSASGTRTTQAVVYTWNNVTNSFQAVVASSNIKPYMDLEYRHYGDGQPQPIAYYDFPDGVILYEDVQYAIGIASVSGSGDVWFNTPPPATTCAHVIGAYQYPIPAYHDGENYPHWITLAVVGSPGVTTLGYSVTDDGKARLEGWVQNAGRMEAGFYHSTNATALAAGLGNRAVWGYTDPDALSRQNFWYIMPAVVDNTTYYFYAFAKIAGIEFEGATLNFTWDDSLVPVTVDSQVVGNDQNGIDFDTTVMGTVSGVSYNLTICYGTTMVAVEGCNSTLSVATGVTSDGSHTTHRALGALFDEGTSYYYRAMCSGNDSSVAYGMSRQFTAYDSSIPDWLNRLIAWLNETFPGLFGGNVEPTTISWWIAIALFALAWLAAGLFRKAWVGVFISGLVILGLWALGMLSGWAIVLIVIIAGFIIFRLVFKQSGATGDA